MSINIFKRKAVTVSPLVDESRFISSAISQFSDAELKEAAINAPSYRVAEKALSELITRDVVFYAEGMPREYLLQFLSDESVDWTRKNGSWGNRLVQWLATISYDDPDLLAMLASVPKMDAMGERLLGDISSGFLDGDTEDFPRLEAALQAVTDNPTSNSGHLTSVARIARERGLTLSKK